MKTENTFGAFEAIIGELGGSQFKDSIGGGADFPVADPSEFEDEEDLNEGEEEKEELEEELDNKETKKIEETEKEDEEEIEQKEEEKKEEDDNPEDSDEEKKEEDLLDLGEFESDVALYVQEKLYEAFGWDINDEEKKFEKVEDIVSYLEKVVEANSTPDFANNQINELNEYVKNGGDVRTYFSTIYGEFDIDSMDVSKETHQELIVREQLKDLGLSKTAIDKRIQRYSDTGILEEEAEEAFEYLQKTKTEKQQKLLEGQKKMQEQVVEQQQKMYEDVSSTIDGLENIYGIKVTSADKKKLKDYIFKSGTDGKTQFQKDYAKNYINLIASAFSTMKGDSLTKGLKRQAESQATKTLRKKLETKTKFGKDSGNNYRDEKENDDSLLSSFASILRKP